MGQTETTAPEPTASGGASGGTSGEEQAAQSEADCRLVLYVANKNMSPKEAAAFSKLLTEMIRSMEGFSWGEEIASELVQLLYSDSIATSTSIPSFGVAHGWGGFLFALLRWAKATRTNPDSIVTEKLSELASLAEPHGGGVRWPVHNATRATSFMDSWCSGTAGHVLLLALAYEVLRAD